MKDLEINIGYIDTSIVALCQDHDHDYAFYAELKKNIYHSRMGSTHGLISKMTFPANIGHRQMVMTALTNHLDIVDSEASEQRYKAGRRNETDRSLN